MSTPLSHFKALPWSAKLLNQPDLTICIRESNPFRETIQQNNGTKDSTFLYRLLEGPGGLQAQAYLTMEIGDAVSGEDGFVHDGFLATVMDEVTGGLIDASGIDQGRGIFTASLNTAYHRPVSAQGFIIAISEVIKVEGRKVFLRSEIRDGDGKICTTAEALFIINRSARG